MEHPFRLRGDSPKLLFCRCRRSILVAYVRNYLPTAIGLLLEDRDVLAFHREHLLCFGVRKGVGRGALTVAKVSRLRDIHLVRRELEGEVLIPQH